MTSLPQLKKKVSSFLTKEDGKISKEKLIKTGVIIGALAVASATVAAGHSSRPAFNTHTNQMSISGETTPGTATGIHSHNIQTTPHSSHSQHSDHDDCVICSGW